MRVWKAFAVGLLAGALLAAVLIGWLPLVRSAQAQHLARLQNVDFDFDTTGSVSTLTFYDRANGEIYLYVATGSSGFKFARRLTLDQLGGPLQTYAGKAAQKIPRLPSGVESEPRSDF